MLQKVETSTHVEWEPAPNGPCRGTPFTRDAQKREICRRSKRGRLGWDRSRGFGGREMGCGEDSHSPRCERNTNHLIYIKSGEFMGI